MRWLPAIAALLMSGAAAAQALSPKVTERLDAALQAYEQLDYEKALGIVRGARAHSNGRADEVRILLLEGVLQTELGRREQAIDSFKRALTLDRRARLWKSVSPVIRRVFSEAREQLPRPAPPPARSRPNDAPTVETKEVPQAQEQVAEAPEAPATVVIPTPVFVQPSVAHEPKAAPRPQGTLVPAAVLGGVAAASGATGVFFGVRSASDVTAAREARYWDQKAAHRRDAVVNANVANISYATAGVAAASALVAWWVWGMPGAAAE